jgi:integrase
VATFSGLRLGEIRALRWRDVDFARQTLFVRASYTHRKLGPPKSGLIRSVPLVDQAAAVLNDLSRRPMFIAPGDLVFCTELGEFRQRRPAAGAVPRRARRRGFR